MSFGYCICYHRPRKVIRQRGFPCRDPLPSLSSDILIFFLNTKQELCCQVSHTPLLFIIYLFMSVEVPCNTLGAEIHIYIHSEPNRSNSHCPSSQVCTTHSVSRVCRVFAFEDRNSHLRDRLLTPPCTWMYGESKPNSPVPRCPDKIRSLCPTVHI